MIAIPWDATSVRRTARTTLVVAVAVFALAMSLPSLYFAVHPHYGLFSFYTDANVVIDVQPQARAAGMMLGDRIDYPAMPAGERYGDPSDGLRLGPMGHPVTFILKRGGQRLTATLKPADPQLNSSSNLINLVELKTSFAVLVLMSCALVLIRPTPLSGAFFLFVVGNARVLPFFYSFLSGPLYAVVMAANDALASVGPIGYALFAVYLGSRGSTPAWIRTAAIIAFSVIALPVVSSDAHELLLGTRPAWPFLGWLSFYAFLVCYSSGIVCFARTALARNTSGSIRIIAALLIIVGLLTVIATFRNAASDAWYFANLPLVALTRALSPAIFNSLFGDIQFASRLLSAILIAYVAVRNRIVDTGPVFGRITSYVIVALAVIGVIGAINVAFEPQLSAYPVLIPLEILLAVAAGYWAGGFRDFAGALSLAMIDAPNAWGSGKIVEERDALTRALGLSERTRQPGLTAEMRAHCAFSAWRQGDDKELERQLSALEPLVRTKPLRGLHGFLNAVRFDESDISLFEQSDLPEWKARSALVACARATDPDRAKLLADEAVEAADSAGLPSLQVLALVGQAENSPDHRDTSLERAHVIARDAGWPAVSKSVLALRAGARDIGVLEPFVDVRLRKRRRATAMFEISFFNGEVRASGVKLPLREKELELLLTVASRQSAVNDNELIDALWPDADGDAARNAFRVCLHRLRKDACDPRIVMRAGKGYAVHPWADVDLWTLQSAVAACIKSGGRENLAELRDLCAAVRAGEGRRAALGDWFLRFERLLETCLEEAEPLLGEIAVQAVRGPTQ